MADVRRSSKKPVAKKAARKPAAKAKPKPVKRMNVFAVPVVEIDVTSRCSHGCFVLIPSSVVVLNFVGIGNRIDVGPGGDQGDILIHTHTGEEDLGEGNCEVDCWGFEEE